MRDHFPDNDWRPFFLAEAEKPYFQELEYRITRAYASTIVYPSLPNLFTAFRLTPVSRVRAVLLGQDPYHNPHQAHGLCFSVQAPTPPPPSLVNVFKEIETSTGRKPSVTGDLSAWATQGVFLLNATLSVEQNKPTSHAGFGWQTFTDHALEYLSGQRRELAFLLWGNYARRKKLLIKGDQMILEAAHPSPLSAHAGFFGCQHFRLVNQFLQAKGEAPIRW